MWVYIQWEANLWMVGFYSPDGQFHTDSNYSSPESAAERVHWLNGGEGDYWSWQAGKLARAAMRDRNKEESYDKNGHRL